MSRVEPKNSDSRGEGRDNSQDDTQRQTRELVSTPDRAEGDENTVDEALEDQDQKKRR